MSQCDTPILPFTYPPQQACPPPLFLTTSYQFLPPGRCCVSHSKDKSEHQKYNPSNHFNEEFGASQTGNVTFFPINQHQRLLFGQRKLNYFGSVNRKIFNPHLYFSIISAATVKSQIEKTTSINQSSIRFIVRSTLSDFLQEIDTLKRKGRRIGGGSKLNRENILIVIWWQKLWPTSLNPLSNKRGSKSDNMPFPFLSLLANFRHCMS